MTRSDYEHACKAEGVAPADDETLRRLADHGMLDAGNEPSASLRGAHGRQIRARWRLDRAYWVSALLGKNRSESR